MPRPARFDQDAILDAALRVISGVPGIAGLSTDAIAAEMGGNVGSIYYRFRSKDHLLAGLWIRCARRGQSGMIAALDADDLDAAVLHYPRWARLDVPAARVLAALGREQLIPRWPDDLDTDLAGVNDDLAQAVRRFTHDRYGVATRAHLQAVTFSLLDLPAAAIRRYLLAGRAPPESLDLVVLAAARSALAAGTGE